MKKQVTSLADAVPCNSRLEWWAKTGWYTAALVPKFGLIPAGFKILEGSGLVVPHLDLIVPLALTGLAAPFWASKGVLLHNIPVPEDLFPSRESSSDRIIRFGEAEFDEVDLYTNILCVGSIGSGKTSTVILPGMEQMFNMYSLDIEDPKSKNPRKKLGGFILEAKGQFYEIATYYMWKAGRNPATDMVVIRPNCRIPTARFRDKKTGYRFWLNALPCSSGSEAGFLLRGKTLPSGEVIPEDVFSKRAKEFLPWLPKLQSLEFDVRGRDVFYVGWREIDGKLMRVSHTPKRDQAEPLLVNGKKLYTAKPEVLIFEGMDYYDNGIHYNLVDNRVGPTEAANKLVLVAKMRDGGGQGGDNAFWVNNAKKHVGACITLMQVTHPDRQVSGPDIQRITTLNDTLKTETDTLEQIIIAKEAEISQEPDPERKAMRMLHEVQVLKDTRAYFTERWGKGLDQKTKGIITEEVTNMFNEFVADPYLQESLCSPATFDFEDAVQKGRVYAFVPGAEYETLAKNIGTILKQDFQQTCLSRVAKSHYDKTRFILILNDECQKFIVSGGQQGGDESFMSLSRESKVCNFMATQSDSWVVSAIGRDAANVYLQSFGGRIWMQNSDPDTNERASKMCGTMKKKEYRTTNRSHAGARFFFNKDASEITRDISFQEKERFKTEDFVYLKQRQAIVFNKGEEERSDTVIKVDLEYSYATGDKGKVEVAECMRRYLRDSLEQALWKTGYSGRVNHTDKPEQTEESPVADTSGALTPEQMQAIAAKNAAMAKEQTKGDTDSNAGSTTTVPPGGATKNEDVEHIALPRKTVVVTSGPKTAGKPNTERTVSDGPFGPMGDNNRPTEAQPTAKGITARSVIQQQTEFSAYYEKACNACAGIEYKNELNIGEFARQVVTNAPREQLSPEEVGNRIIVGAKGVHGGNREISRKTVPRIPVSESMDLIANFPAETDKLKSFHSLRDQLASQNGPSPSSNDMGDFFNDIIPTHEEEGDK